jgi:hypothetical protein
MDTNEKLAMAAMMRAEARQLSALSRNSTSPALRKAYAHKGLSLALSAEVLERAATEQPRIR